MHWHNEQGESMQVGCKNEIHALIITYIIKPTVLLTCVIWYLQYYSQIVLFYILSHNSLYNMCILHYEII